MPERVICSTAVVGLLLTDPDERMRAAFLVVSEKCLHSSGHAQVRVALVQEREIVDLHSTHVRHDPRLGLILLRVHRDAPYPTATGGYGPEIARLEARQEAARTPPPGTPPRGALSAALLCWKPAFR